MKIIYWSETGNTKAIAELIKTGIEQEGKNAELRPVGEVSIDDVINEEILIIGCPACGVETLDETEMEPFISSLEGKISGKKVALFGSYGWGNGEWMDEWEERISSYGEILISEGLRMNEASADENECIEFGKVIANQ